MKIKVNDNVKVISGKDRGKTGKVIQSFPCDEKIVVEGVNVMKKNVRPKREGQKGQIVEYNAPMHVSNVMLTCPKCSKPTRFGYNISSKGGKSRSCKKCKETF
ncbi:MAG: 50S ribosomal protein L24 [uncultured bacterium]|nr:MAG: 50S ribosomal protein L24 [uncultured bacterium]